MRLAPDKHPSGEPVISNGLALCKLHHAAFDSHIVGIRPDCTIEVREDVLAEKDGPMLATKVLNQAVRRNLERFPEDFMFATDGR